MPSIQREWRFGENVVLFEPPNLLRAKYKGLCTLSDATRMIGIFRELAAVHPLFILSDMQEAGAVEPEARHYYSEHFQTEWLASIIIYKSRLMHRAIMMGLRLAIEMTRSDQKPFLGRIHFVSTLEQAETLLAQLRSRPD